ncbi:DUF3823 domain-containing protein [Larkinella knui]|uniref:DUF3823 domain-containing protein n=1 Tax=Larkinella knui TaxID=2025310 RepID=A0A3P1CCJ7_9BACT|nr:DUF3823 domain-containing protein [Larkinella knui]RRB10940.1 DUF3823 domain-containing protein [Larkinella knui]
MKPIKLVFFLPVLFVAAISGCKNWDNFVAPDAGIYGKVTDAENGQPLELRQPGGGTVRFIQWDKAKYPNPGTTDIELKANGEFSASQFFAGTYKALPRDGAFLYQPGDSATVDLGNGDRKELNFKVTPFYRIAASVTDSTFTYTITKPAANTTTKISQIIFMINDYAKVDESISSNTSGYFINLWRQDIAGSVTDASLVGTPRTFTFKWADTHLPKGEYYFRVGVRTTGVAKYNYSPVVKARVR